MCDLWPLDGHTGISGSLGLLQLGLPCLPMQEAAVLIPRFKRSSSLEDPLEEEMATHSSIPAWRTPWIEEPGRLQSMGTQNLT